MRKTSEIYLWNAATECYLSKKSRICSELIVGYKRLRLGWQFPQAVQIFPVLGA